MTKVEMQPIDLLRWILLALENEKVETAKDILRDAIAQLEERGQAGEGKDG